MLTGKYYYWIDNQVIEKDPAEDPDIMNTVCLDDCTRTPEYRYGLYIEGASDRFCTWEPIAPKDFPKEFTMALMLLGIE